MRVGATAAVPAARSARSARRSATSCDGAAGSLDWAPRTSSAAAETAVRRAQLRLYRRAYQARSGVPAELIDVVLYYVADDLVIRD